MPFFLVRTEFVTIFAVWNMPFAPCPRAAAPLRLRGTCGGPGRMAMGRVPVQTGRVGTVVGPDDGAEADSGPNPEIR